MIARSTLLTITVVLLGTRFARADDSPPARWWLAAAVGADLYPSTRDGVMGTTDPTISGDFLLGIDVAYRHTLGGKALVVDAAILPIGGYYRARATAIVGKRTRSAYWSPAASCAGVPGAGPDSTCTATYRDKLVVGTQGLAIGGSVSWHDSEVTPLLELGFGRVAQISIDVVAQVDPARGGFGGGFRGSLVFGRLVMGIDMSMLVYRLREEPVPIAFFATIGYAGGGLRWNPS